MKKCCICDKTIEREDAPILTLGGAGYARLLCDECDSELQLATLSHDVEEIKTSINSLGNKMANGDPDHLTYNLVSSILMNATDRGMKIKDGTYDFALDEAEEEEGFDEIPEELLESEEDIALDKADEEKMKKFDKVYNYMLIGAIIALVGLVIYKLIDAFFLK